MTASSNMISDNLPESHQRELFKAIAKVRLTLKKAIAERSDENAEVSKTIDISDISSFEPSAPNFDSHLAQLCEKFDLSDFEKDILLLCTGMELDANWGSLCAEAANDPKQNYPTFNLAMSVLDFPDWSVLSPAANLRRWHMVEIGAGNALTASTLRINERILHYLMGDQHLDGRLLQILKPVNSHSVQIDSHQQITNQAISTWVNASESSDADYLPVLQLCGEDVTSKAAIAFDICGDLKLKLYKVPASLLPQDLSNLQLIAQLCDREYRLNDIVLMLDCDRDEALNQSQDIAIGHLIEILRCPLIISSQNRLRQHQRTIITFEIQSPSIAEQQTLWQKSLNEVDSEIPDSLNSSLNDSIHQLVSYFNLSPSLIYNASLKAKSIHQQQPDQPFHQTLWEACRAQSRPRLDELSQRVENAATWEDLILPSKEKFVLHDIAAHVRQRLTVYEQWGFAGKSRRGLGISALFAGTSGTGKTMAAEILGNELQLDVYRIDLSSVIDKYIGETEKNLKRIFDAAESGGVILLFDEADALFGKRTEVKDSHDRHANVGVSYLLQRMEAYRGLAVLTTNLKNSLDQAFLRRLRFVIQFPFPDTEQRTEIWRKAFPKQTPILDLDYLKLGKLSVAGGNIRNIALNAAFIAADHHQPVQMKHILQAAKIEYIKLEKPMMDTEIKGWV